MKTADIKDVKIPVKLILGETEISLQELAEMGQGSIVGLNTLAGEPAIFEAAGKKVARGEVVVIDEIFGVRITQLIEEED